MRNLPLFVVLVYCCLFPRTVFAEQERSFFDEFGEAVHCVVLDIGGELPLRLNLFGKKSPFELEINFRAGNFDVFVLPRIWRNRRVTVYFIALGIHSLAETILMSRIMPEYRFSFLSGIGLDFRVSGRVSIKTSIHFYAPENGVFVNLAAILF